MTTPRYTEEQIWGRLRDLVGCRVNSLTDRKSHLVVSIDPAAKAYTIEYESGNTKRISLDEIYALYAELYLLGILTYGYMRLHAKRLLGWSSWHAPGSAMMAILPLLDDNITVTGGTLSLEHIKT